APLVALALLPSVQAQTLDATSTTTDATLQSVSVDPTVAALRQASNTFTRMFRTLPSFAPQTDAVRAAMQQLGAIGGVLDAKDVLTDP
ncbi:hypothetical protein ABTM68_20085, partial [Acinetobacter baumannii]